MSTIIPPQEFVIDYKLEDVKNAINIFINDLNMNTHGYYHASKDSNEMFNLYAFNIWKTDFMAGMVTGNMQVNLIDVDGVKTKVMVKSIAKTQGVLDNSRIMDIQSDFLKKLQQSINGEYVKETASSTANNSGCMLMLSLIFVISYFLFS